jgi:hypothetical protein
MSVETIAADTSPDPIVSLPLMRIGAIWGFLQMRPLRIAFSDGLSAEKPFESRILRLLSQRLQAVAADFDQADLLIYSDFGRRHQEFKGLKVYITGENMVPDFAECDLAYAPMALAGNPRSIRLPYYAQVLPHLGSLVRPDGYDPSESATRTRFCSFVASNPRGAARNRFFKMLHKRKPLVSAGRHFNTTGQPLADKLGFLRDFRFNLAFENSSSPGYVTEKLVEPLLMGVIPIYWGADDVGNDFNPECMIDVRKFADFEQAIDHILAVDEDPARRLGHLRATPFHGNREPACLGDDYLVRPLLELITSQARPGLRHYSERRLRAHTYESKLHQTFSSLRCRIESSLWKLGWR